MTLDTEAIPRIDAALSGVLRIGVLRTGGVRVAAADEALRAEVTRAAAKKKSAFADLDVGSIPGVQDARKLYRALGIDPTRTRPSSEALLLRALKGQLLPAISNAVDVANLVAFEHLLPVGLYDAARISGPIEIRVGRAGEQYEGIRKDSVHLEGRIALADERGPFGNPTADSRRTMVTEATTEILFVMLGPREVDADRLRAALARADELLTRHASGRLVGTALVP